MDRHMGESLDHWLTTPPEESEPDPTEYEDNDPEGSVTVQFETPNGVRYSFDIQADCLAALMGREWSEGMFE